MAENEKNLSQIILEAARIKGYSIEKLSQLTGVSERFLNFLVEEKFHLLPPAPYVHGYLMKIAAVLDLDGKKIWSDYLKDNSHIRRSGEKDYLPQNRFSTEVSRKKLIWIVLALVVFGGYVVFRILSFYNEPTLTLNIKDNFISKVPQLTIEGKTDNLNQLTINGEPVYLNDNGAFQKQVELQPGFNTFTFKIKRLLGKEHTIIKRVFYQASPPDALKSQSNELH
jgi:cytoskeletal protein RodZ